MKKAAASVISKRLIRIITSLFKDCPGPDLTEQLNKLRFKITREPRASIQSKKPSFARWFKVVPWARLELARGYSPRWILSPMRLPIPPPGRGYLIVMLP